MTFFSSPRGLFRSLNVCRQLSHRSPGLINTTTKENCTLVLSWSPLPHIQQQECLIMSASLAHSKSSAENARFESAAIYLAHGVSPSAGLCLSLGHSLSESSIVPTKELTSTSFKRIHSPEYAKADNESPSRKLPVRRPMKRSRIDSNLSASVSEVVLRTVVR